jgi:hypothetical protein
MVRPHNFRRPSMTANAEIPAEVQSELEELIGSEDSPVGIDAKKTHVLILYKLLEIERRLVALESRLDGDAGAQP